MKKALDSHVRCIGEERCRCHIDGVVNVLDKQHECNYETNNDFNPLKKFTWLSKNDAAHGGGMAGEKQVFGEAWVVGNDGDKWIAQRYPCHGWFKSEQIDGGHTCERDEAVSGKTY